MKVLFFCAVVGPLGCSAPESLPGPRPQPVKGKVMYGGKPAEGFCVAFHAVEHWQGAQFAPAATTDANGEYQLKSYAENDGAPVGDYTVTFTWPREVPGLDPDDAPEIVDQLHGAYSNPHRSKFTATVVEGENVLEPFVLK